MKLTPFILHNFIPCMYLQYHRVTIFVGEINSAKIHNRMYYDDYLPSIILDNQTSFIKRPM